MNTVAKYKIDESHGLSHAFQVLTQANSIYESEVIKIPELKEHEKVIYIAAIVHDMCDDKYINIETGLDCIVFFLSTNKVFKLAEEELVHYRLFSKMAVNVVKIVNEAPLHKLNLLNNFNQNKLTCESCDEIKKAINFAINEEQKAHDDYSVIAKHLDFGDGRDVLEEMARQEMRHKLLLQKVLEKMEKENVAVFSN